MTRLKQFIALTILSGSLIAPALALAEPTPPPGTTVNTIALTTVETNITSSSGTPVMNAVPSSTTAPAAAMTPMTDPAPAEDMAGDDVDMAQ